MFDAGSGTCLPACGPDEKWDGAACAPVCAPGTVLNPDSGQCEPGPDACAPGTTWVDGVCVADLICGSGTHQEGDQCVPDQMPDPDVSESADPDLPATFELPAAGEQVSLGGTVAEPADGNGDGYVEGDWDVFAVTAPAGTWLRIQATSQAACLPAFMVLSTEEDEDGYALYARYGLNPVGLVADREIYLPRAGAYLIMVTDLHNLLMDVFGAGFIPVGGEDFSYYVTVQNLGDPQPTEVVSLPLADEGALSAGLGFYHLADWAARDVLTIRSATEPLPDVANDLIPATLLFDPAGDLMVEAVGGWNEDALTTVVLPADGGYLVVQDYLVATGPALDFGLEAFLEPVVDCTQQVCAPEAIAEGAHLLWSYDLSAGDFFLFNATVPADSPENLGVWLLDDSFGLLSEASAGPSWNRWDTVYAEQDTWVYLMLAGWFGGAVPTWTLDVVHEALPSIADGAATHGIQVHAMPADTIGDCGLGRFTATAGQIAVVTGFTPHDPALAWVSPAHELSDPDLGYLGPAFDTVDVDLARLDPPVAFIPEDGTYLHRALDTDAGAAIAGGSYDLRLDLLTPTDLGEPVAGAPVTVNAQALHTDAGVAFYLVQVTDATVYDFSVTPAGGASLRPELRVMAFGYHYNTNWYSRAGYAELGMIAQAAAAGPGDPAAGAITAPYDGLLIVQVQDADGQAGADTFDLQVGVGL